VSFLLKLSDTEWSRLMSLVQALSTVAVALLVAWLAIRKETKVQKMQRHFAFGDERAELYSVCVQLMNTCVARYWETSGADTDPFTREAKALEAAALELDTHTMKIQIRAPKFVSHACMNVNGHLQHVSSGVVLGAEWEPLSEEFEVAKRNMLKAMQQDISVIEETSDRREYAERVRVQDNQYEKEALGALKKL
jgi:hypothetical protein